MAKALDPTDTLVDFRRTRGESWFQGEWLDGQPWMLEAGVDFPNSSENATENARTRLYNEAARVNKAGRAKALGNGDIIFQAYEMTEDERMKKDAATEKRSATRAANKAAGIEPVKRNRKSAG